jgi:hypothetical protein
MGTKLVSVRRSTGRRAARTRAEIAWVEEQSFAHRFLASRRRVTNESGAVLPVVGIVKSVGLTSEDVIRRLDIAEREL